MNDSWREDRSSVSSWSAGASGAGTFTSFNTSLSAMVRCLVDWLID